MEEPVPDNNSGNQGTDRVPPGRTRDLFGEESWLVDNTFIKVCLLSPSCYEYTNLVSPSLDSCFIGSVTYLSYVYEAVDQFLNVTQV